jgi:hypothetical protein
MNESHLANWGSVIQHAQRGVQSMHRTSERRMKAAPLLLCSIIKGKERCNIPSQGLTGLIRYSYQQVATSFLEAHLQRTLRLSVLGLEQFQDGWPTRKSIPGAHE